MVLINRLLRSTAASALACALALPLALPAPAAAQSTATPPNAAPETPVTLWDNFSLENILTMFVQSMIPSLRVLADVRYDQIDVDPVRNRLALVGVDIRPFLPYVQGDSCAIKVDSAVLSGAPIDRQAGYVLNLALDGAVMDFDCLPNEARPVVGLAGLENIRLDRAHISAHYDFATGGAQIGFGADMDELLALTGQADLDYISYRMDFDTEEVVPAVHVNHVSVTAENRGLYRVAQQMLPPDMLAPDAAAEMIGGALMGIMMEMNAGAAPIAEQEQFIAAAQEVARAFVQNPGQIVIETAPPSTPVRLGEGDLETPQAIFAKLAPTASTSPRAIANGISAAELKQAIDGLLPTARNLDVGRALLSGVGAPRNVTLGLRLLDPLAKDGNSEAAYLMAGAMAATQPDIAYRLALSAAAKGQSGALSLLSDLEDTLPLALMLDQQDAMLGGGGPVASDYASIGDIRRAARGHLMGNTRIRSYRAAYYWASVGAATGDAASASIRDDIDVMMRLRGAEQAWSEVRTSLENGVLRDWVGRDLPSALQK